MIHLKTVCGILFFCGAIFIIAKAVKHVSYHLWYKDMVQETVRGMVRAEYLK